MNVAKADVPTGCQSLGMVSEVSLEGVSATDLSIIPIIYYTPFVS